MVSVWELVSMGILYLEGKVTFANEVHATLNAQTVCAFLIYQKPHEFEMQLVAENSIPNKFPPELLKPRAASPAKSCLAAFPSA